MWSTSLVRGVRERPLQVVGKVGDGLEGLHGHLLLSAASLGIHKLLLPTQALRGEAVKFQVARANHNFDSAAFDGLHQGLLASNHLDGDLPDDACGC
jgi:hypothetical protein